MVAVSAFVGRSPRAGSAALFGFRWGFGHALVVLVVGGVLAWTGVSVPSSAEAWAELAVGLMLVALGFWAMRASRRLHVHRPEDHHGHAHLHAHTPRTGIPTPTITRTRTRSRGTDTTCHATDTSPPWWGQIHGLAGTAPIVALIPVTLLHRDLACDRLPGGLRGGDDSRDGDCTPSWPPPRPVGLPPR